MASAAALQPLGPQAWTLIADGGREIAVQLLFAAALQPQGPAGGGAAGGPTGSHPVDMVNFPFGVFRADLVDGDRDEPDREIYIRITAHIADNFPIRNLLP